MEFVIEAEHLSKTYKTEGKKLVAVGTTTVRTLETAYKQFGCVKACKSASLNCSLSS